MAIVDEIWFGSMMAGKTTKLLEKISEQKEKGEKCVVFKYIKDTRCDSDFIMSHDGKKMEAIAVENLMNELSIIEKFDVIGID
jgi:thymidine kinase